MLRIAIVEDEDVAAAQLEACLEKYCSQYQLEYSGERFSDGEAFLQNYVPRYDIVFMDIKMPGADGVEVAERLRKKDHVTVLIFVTNMVQYAVKGYELNALDFIVKPVRYASFEMKMKRAVLAVEVKRGKEVILNVGGTTYAFASSSIYYVEVMDHELTYHTDRGEFTVRGKLGTVAQTMPEDIFFRCSASYLINLQYVTQIAGETVRVAGKELRVSRSKRKALLAAMAAFIGKGV